MKLIFTPVGIIAGLLAGVIGSKIFEKVWAVIDDEDAPEPKYREIPLAKMIVALLLQGAISRVIRGLVDHGTRHGFARLTGEWPGDEHPEPKGD